MEAEVGSVVSSPVNHPVWYSQSVRQTVSQSPVSRIKCMAGYMLRGFGQLWLPPTARIMQEELMLLYGMLVHPSFTQLDRSRLVRQTDRQ